MKSIGFEIVRIRFIDEVTAQCIFFEHHLFEAEFNGKLSATDSDKKIFYLCGHRTETVDHLVVEILQFLFSIAVIQPGVQGQSFRYAFYIAVWNQDFQVSIDGTILNEIVLPADLIFEQVSEFSSFQFLNGLIKYLLIHLKSDLCHKARLLTTQQITSTTDIKITHRYLETAA